MSETIGTESAGDWPVRRLGDIARVTRGGTPKRNISENFDGPIPWVQASEVGDDNVNGTQATITLEGLASSNGRVFAKGTLGIVLSGPNAGKLGILGIEAALDQSICAVLPSPEMDVHFLFWYFENKRRELTDLTKGSKGSKIGLRLIRNCLVPMPPLSEQLRIVTEIEQQIERRDELLAILRRAHAQSKQYRALLAEMATEGTLVPNEARAAISESRLCETGASVLDRILQLHRTRVTAQHRSKLETVVRYTIMSGFTTTPMGFLEAWLIEMILADLDLRHQDAFEKITRDFLNSVDVFGDPAYFMRDFAYWLSRANAILRTIGVKSDVLGKPRDLSINRYPESIIGMLQESSLNSQFVEFNMSTIRRRWLEKPAEENFREAEIELRESVFSTAPWQPDGWAWTNLAAVADLRIGVTHRQIGPLTSGIRSVPCMRATNIQSGRLDLADVKERFVSDKNRVELQLIRGDLLLNMGSDLDKRGRGWIWDGELPDCIFDKSVVRARILDGAIQPKFIAMCLDSLWPRVQAELGQQENDPDLPGLLELRRFPVPIPPPKEQERIVEEFEHRMLEMRMAEERLSSIVEQIEESRKSYTERAFKGES